MVTLEIPKRIILDSTIIIGILRNKLNDVQLVRKIEAKADIATTTINAFEIYFGAYKSKNLERNLASTKGFFSTIKLLPFDDNCAELAGQVLAELESKGKTIDYRDLFIGCITLSNGYTLITRNKKHFQDIPRLHVIDPSEL
ncbi:MAG: type II toxin-antitoxin system VapC family toxin [Nitrososphaerota archaeon]